MSRRPNGGAAGRPSPHREGRYGEGRAGRWSGPWVIRGVIAVAVVILAVALVYAGLHGFLFALPSH